MALNTKETDNKFTKLFLCISCGGAQQPLVIIKVDHSAPNEASLC